MNIKDLRLEQNPNLLSMIALGTEGGELRADGSTMEAGIHLRWQMGEAIGFPPDGFDVYRRDENLDLGEKFGTFIQRDNGVVEWICRTPGAAPVVEIIFSGESEGVRACGQSTLSSVFWPGEQTVRFLFHEAVRYVQVTFDRSTPLTTIGTALWYSPQGPITVDHSHARREPGRTRTLTLFADCINELVLSGEGMTVCELAFTPIGEGYEAGWGPPLNGDCPIYLPITHPVWGSPHPLSTDDQAEAESRLPLDLSADKRSSYTNGFATELHQIIYDLVGTDPQHLHRVDDPDTTSGAKLNWSGLQLLQLTALDPNLARILGLYWHDEPPDPDRYYDYKVVGHYGGADFPRMRGDYSQLDVGQSCGTQLSHQGVRYVSPNPMSVVQTERSGSLLNALYFAQTIHAPISISLPFKMEEATLYVSNTGDVTVKGYLGTNLVVTQDVSSGENTIELEYSGGIDSLVIEANGELTIFEIVLLRSSDILKDVSYITFHHRTRSTTRLRAPRLEQPVAIASRTGLDELGNLVEHQTSVGLRWTLPKTGESLIPEASILYQVQRADRGNEERPDPIGPSILLNENAPVLVTESRTSSGESNEPRTFYTDRNLPDGWHSYQVRGVDLFGRVSAWSPEETIQTLDCLPPPPPQKVVAQYLDQADPWLGRSDHDWATTEGPGLRVNWEWPGILRMQAPDVAPTAAEFRVYSNLGELNQLSGNVVAVTRIGGFSQLTTDIFWYGADDELAGEAIRVGNNFFAVVSNTSRTNCVLEVKNLTAPELVPTPGPCTLVFTRDRSYWADYAVNTNWQQRLYVEPVADTPIVRGQVTRVAAYSEHQFDVISHPGATHTVVTDQPLTGPAPTLTPGAFLCDGVVYQAYGHTLGSKLKIHIVPPVSPTDESVLVVPPRHASFVYYPGQKYEVLIPDFNLEIASGEASAVAQVAVSCSDGKPYAADHPDWSDAKRGALGGRPGNEGPLSTICKVTAIKRTLPAVPQNVPLASDPIFAKPANYYGQAHYTLTWESVPDAIGYAIYRCSGAALFDRDRKQRQKGKEGKGYYAFHGVFADDPKFADWLSAYNASLADAVSLTKHDLISSPDSHLDAWRAWADHFYPGLTEAEVQDLANRRGNENPLRRVNKDPVEANTYLDTFDGRGQGLYLYRIRAIDAANNLSDWSDTFPPVHIYDVTPPATPVITSIFGAEKSVTIRWRANIESDLKEYWIWRAATKGELADVRRLSPTQIVMPTVETLEESHTEPDLVGGTVYYFRLAAADTNGNVSQPTAIQKAQPIETIPPEPPVWESAEWNPDQSGIDLVWTLADQNHQVLVQRSSPQEGNLQLSVSSWLPPGNKTFADRLVRDSKTYHYRLRVRSTSGMMSASYNEVQVDPINIDEE